MLGYSITVQEANFVRRNRIYPTVSHPPAVAEGRPDSLLQRDLHMAAVSISTHVVIYHEDQHI